jgi:hypothetical protein
MFVAAARITVRWITQHDQDAQDLVQEACNPRPKFRRTLSSIFEIGRTKVMREMRGQSGRTAHPEVAACQVHSAVSFETSKTPRSVVLAVSSSTIKRLSEHILLKMMLLRSPRLYLSASEFTLTAKKIRIKTRTQRRPVPIVVFEIQSLMVTWHGTYQPGVNSRPR